MKQILKYALVLLLSFVSSYTFATDKTDSTEATTATGKTVTFCITGDAGTYKFYYPEQVVITHSGLGTTTVTMDVTAIAGSGALTTIDVKRNNTTSTSLIVYGPGCNSVFELDGGETSANFVVSFSKSDNPTVYLTLK